MGRAKIGFVAPDDELVLVKRSELADLFEEAAKAALVRSGAVIEDATYHQLMAAAGMATEKMRLLREQATSIDDGKVPTIRVVFDDTAPPSSS